MKITVDSGGINNEQQLKRITSILFPNKKATKKLNSQQKNNKIQKNKNIDRLDIKRESEKQNKRARSNSNLAQAYLQKPDSEIKKRLQNRENKSLNNQIQRFKYQMRALLQKQDLKVIKTNWDNNTDHVFNQQTQRHFLQGVQSLSNRIRIQNFPEQIQLASQTLLTCLPTHEYSISISKYYKISTLCKNLTEILVRKAINWKQNAFSNIYKNWMSYRVNKKMPKNRLLLTQKQRECANLKRALNKWHYTSMYEKSMQRLALYNNDLSISHLGNLINLLPQEAKLVYYIQANMLNSKIKQNQSQTFYQIVLYNRKSETLRAFHCKNKQLGGDQHQNGESQASLNNNKSIDSYYQSVSNCSILKNPNALANEKNPQFQTNQFNILNLQNLSKMKLKRFEFPLQKNSLTQMCIDERQILKIKNLQKNPQYSKIDGSIDMHGIVNSARSAESVRMIGKSLNAVFYPLLINNQVIGVVRQYSVLQKNQLKVCDFDFPEYEIPQKQIELITQLIYVSIGLSCEMRIISEQIENKKQGYYMKFVCLLKNIEAIHFQPQLNRQNKSFKKNILRLYEQLESQLKKLFMIQQFQVYQIQKVQKQALKQAKGEQVIKGVFIQKIYRSKNYQSRNIIDSHILPMIKIFDTNKIEYINQINHHVFKIRDKIYDINLPGTTKQNQNRELNKQKVKLPITLLQKIFKRVEQIYSIKQEQKVKREALIQNQKLMQKQKQCILKSQICEREISKIFATFDKFGYENSALKAIQKFLKRVTHENDYYQLVLQNSKRNHSVVLDQISSKGTYNAKSKHAICLLQSFQQWNIQIHYTFIQESTLKLERDIIDTLKTFIRKFIENQIQTHENCVSKHLICKAKKVHLDFMINNKDQFQKTEQMSKIRSDIIIQKIIQKIFSAKAKIITSEQLSKQIIRQREFSNKTGVNIASIFPQQRLTNVLQIPKKIGQVLKNCECFAQGQQFKQLTYFNICQQKHKVIILAKTQCIDQMLIKELSNIYNKISNQCQKSKTKQKGCKLSGLIKIFHIVEQKFLRNVLNLAFINIVQSTLQLQKNSLRKQGSQHIWNQLDKKIFGIKIVVLSKLKVLNLFNSQRRQKISIMLSKLQRYQNRVVIRIAFSKIYALQTVQSSQEREQKYQYQIRQNCNKIAISLQNVISPCLEKAYLQIYAAAKTKRYYKSVFILLCQIAKKAKRKAFKQIMKFSEKQTSNKMQISLIGQVSRSKSFREMFKIIENNYPKLQLAYKLDNQSQYLIPKSMKIINQDCLFELYKGFQKFEGLEQNNRVIWFYFQDSTDSTQLLDIALKNQLTVISKAIVETIKRNTYNQKPCLSLINIIAVTSQRKELKQCFQIWRKLALDQIVLQKYGQRQLIYHLNLESQTIKEKIRVKVRENQENQAANMKLQKRKQDALSKIESLRTKIIQLDISSKQLEKQCKFATIKKVNANMKHYFRQWRIKVAKKFIQKKQNVIDVSFIKEAANLVKEFMHEKTINLVKQCFRQLSCLCVHQKVQEENINSQRRIQDIRQQDEQIFNDGGQFNQQFSNTIYKQLQEYQHSFFVKQNPRLLTFQNNSGNQQQNSNQQSLYYRQLQQQNTHLNYQFKQIGAYQKDKYIAYQHSSHESQQDEYRFVPFNKKQCMKHDRCELTPQDIKKGSQGKYKLNLKTLKFLKRMGKLQDI